VINNILNFSKEEGFIIKGLTFSPIKGPEGNIEYLLWLGLSETEIQHQNIDADAVVREVFSGDSFD
jgi:23S rRNA (cytidine1920-2'-O)/16S rRNA (cytidine1409-2'-O)-methyltransferase